MADFDVVVGAVVADVAAVVGVVPVAAELDDVPDDQEVDAPEAVVEVCAEVAEDEEPVPDGDDGVELTVVGAAAAVPGISLDTMRPTAAVAPVARMAAALDRRRTRAPARSRRVDPCALGSLDRPIEAPTVLGPGEEVLMARMSPCESRGSRTAG